MIKGKVYLTGAGPGDTGLITLKAIECLKKAQVVIYDRLVNPELLKYAPADAEIIYVGKSSKTHSLTQDKINQLIVKKAKEDKTVVRLKGGDPFLFGRGGEEALELVKNKIPFEIVPGVSSAIAVAAYAGIPLTHRQFTSSVGIFTGHENPLKEGSRIDWEKISTGLGTLVFLMGVENLEPIVKNLLKFGRSPFCPCALIQNGTLPKQKTLSTTLDKIIKAAKAFRFQPPSILIVGEVVSLRKKLNWLESLPCRQAGKPLFGKRILITRPKDEDSRFSQILEEYGAQCAELAAIAIKPLKDYSQLDAAIKDIAKFQWLIFSSQNGVKFFKQRLNNFSHYDKTAVKFAAIGPRTALALEDFGLKVSLQPKEFCQEGLLKSFAKLKLKGQNILIINALEARDVLARGLEKMGATVTVTPAYQTIHQPQTANRKPFNFDIITFTSSLAAKGLLSGVSQKTIQASFKNTLIASIGPITSRAIKEAGLKVAIEAKEYTLEGLAKAIINYYKK